MSDKQLFSELSSLLKGPLADRVLAKSQEEQALCRRVMDGDASPSDRVALASIREEQAQYRTLLEEVQARKEIARKELARKAPAKPAPTSLYGDDELRFAISKGTITLGLDTFPLPTKFKGLANAHLILWCGAGGDLYVDRVIGRYPSGGNVLRNRLRSAADWIEGHGHPEIAAEVRRVSVGAGPGRIRYTPTPGRKIKLE